MYYVVVLEPCRVFRKRVKIQCCAWRVYVLGPPRKPDWTIMCRPDCAQHFNHATSLNMILPANKHWVCLINLEHVLHRWKLIAFILESEFHMQKVIAFELYLPSQCKWVWKFEHWFEGKLIYVSWWCTMLPCWPDDQATQITLPFEKGAPLSPLSPDDVTDVLDMRWGMGWGVLMVLFGRRGVSYSFKECFRATHIY